LSEDEDDEVIEVVYEMGSEMKSDYNIKKWSPQILLVKANLIRRFLNHQIYQNVVLKKETIESVLRGGEDVEAEQEKFCLKWNDF
jgi:hypothetical protein